MTVTDARWPELFVVGAHRAGTTSLWDYLNQHPQIFMSRLKEPHFFATKKPAVVPVVSDEASYLRLFASARPGQLRGEASPSYLRDRAARDAIARVRPDARIVVALRDPVARAYSSYWHSIRYGRQRLPFSELVRAQLADPDARPAPAPFVPGGLYADAIQGYLEVFDGRVHVVFLEELAADPRVELRRLFGFLGVDEAEADRVRLGVRNAAGLPRNALLQRAYASTRLRFAAARLVPGALHARFERALLRGDAVPPIDPEARRLLEEFYVPEVAALERVLGRRVPWRAYENAPMKPSAAGVSSR